MSDVAAAGGSGLTGAAATSIFGVSISGDSSVMSPACPSRRCTLAADRHPLNRFTRRAIHNIVGAAGHVSARFGAPLVTTE